MKGERRFRACVLATALLSQFAYSMAAEKPFFLVLGIIAALYSARQVSAQMAGTAEPIWRTLLNTLVLVAIGHLIFQLLRSDRQEPITSLTDFLSYVMLVKMLDRGRMRDEAQLLGLSLFVVIGSLLTGQSLSLGLVLILYTPMAILCTVLLQVFAGRERMGNRLAEAGIPGGRAEMDAALARTRAWRALMRTGVMCVAFSMAVGVVGFLLTPRQLAQLGGIMGPLKKSPTTGFSDTMKLGDSGLIAQGTETVMDIAVQAGSTGAPAALPSTIYLRGAVLNYYDPETGQWSARTQHTDRRPESRELSKPGARRPTMPEGTIASYTIPEVSGLRRVLRYDIVQRNTKNGKVPLFAPLQPLRVTADAALSVEYQDDFSLLMTSSQSGRLTYSVTATPDYRPENPARDPVQQFSPTINALANEILAEARVDQSRFKDNPAAVRHAAQAVVAYLAKFQYTLEMVAPPAGTDPLEDFLFTRKAGHCEYFAAAMTALLESMNVPSRVVTGYAAGEYNPVSGRYTVRQSDAHAWVEVLTSDNRWETFDPTPPGELPSTLRHHSGPLAWARNLWDAIEFSWLDNVVAYDKGIRIDLSGPRTGDAAYRWQKWILGWSDQAKAAMPKDLFARSVVIGALVFGVVMGAFAIARLGGGVLRRLGPVLVRLLGFRRTRGGSGVLITEQTRFYRHALDALTEGGVPKPETVTPLNHAAVGVSPRSVDAGAAFERLTRLYYAARFGGQATSDGDRQGAEADVRLLRQRLVKAAAT